MSTQPFTPSELAECAEREVKQRLRAYPRWVADGRMTQPQADRQIAMMRQIASEYRAKDNANPAASGRML